MKKYELNRKQYDRIRKMDHNDMEEYMNAVYENGYRAGERAASEKAAEVPDLIGLEEEMQNIRGIGGAKARAVREVVKSFFERKVAGPDETGSEISGE